MLDSALPERSSPERSPPERTEQPPPTVPAERTAEQVAKRDPVTAERPATERPVESSTGKEPTDEEPTDGSNNDPIPVVALVLTDGLPIPAVPAAVIPEIAPVADAPALPGVAEVSPNPAVLPVPETAMTPVSLGAVASAEPAVAPSAAKTAPPPAVDGPKPLADAAVPVEPADPEEPVAPTRPQHADIPHAADKKSAAVPDAPPVKTTPADLPAKSETTAAPTQPTEDQSPLRAASAPEKTKEDVDAHLDPDAKPAAGKAAAHPDRHADALLARARPSGPSEAPLNPAPGTTATPQDTTQPLNLTLTPAAVANGLQGSPPAATSAPNLAAYAPAVAMSGLAVEIVVRARDGQNRFEIRLDPPELGRIDVHLQMDRDGNVTSRLYVERSETLDLLRRDAPQLERALNHAGLKTSDQGMEFSLRDQGFGRDPGAREGAAVNRLIIPDEQQPASTAGSFYGRRLGLGAGIDIRV